MKKIICSLACFLLFQTAYSQFVTIPDDNFRYELMQLYPSCFNANEEMDTTCTDIVNENALFVNNLSIFNLDGIQYFDNLQILECSNNLLASLPTLPSTLTKLECDNNQLTSLPKLPNSLIVLICGNNQLTSLPVLPILLKQLWCFTNRLTYLPTLPNSLNQLYCDQNQLTVLPFLPNNLIELDCSDNQLTNLPLLPNSLISLTCNFNQLTSLPFLPDTLNDLYCYSNQLTNLPSLPNSLKTLNCINNYFLNCLPLLSNTIYALYNYNTAITCLPNKPPGIATNPLPICSGICEPLPTASGLVFHDINANQVYDLGVDSVLKGWGVTNSNGWSSVSLQNGEYIVKLDSGVLNTLTLNPLTYSTVSPTSQVITPTSSGSQGNTFHFAVNFIPNIQDLSTYISAGTARPGFDQWVSVSVNNIGTAPVNNATLKVLKPTFATFLNANPPISAQNADTLIWNNVNINTLNTQNYQINWNISSATTIGTDYEIKSWITPLDTTPNNNAHVYNDVVRGSYDPNDKKVNLVLLDPLTLNSELVYTIRFQNTGTDTAFNILIRDTLSNHLDMSSFRVISASHDHSFLLRDHSLLEVFFQNILLPDSNTNEPKSHGYVTYAVKPKSTLQIGENIENTAYIFFDFNLPIVTNTTQTQMVLSNIGSNIETKEAKIYPNPAQDEVLFENADDAQVQLFDLTGKLVLESEVKQGKINITSVPNGLYVVNLFRDKVQMLKTKLSIQK